MASARLNPVGRARTLVLFRRAPNTASRFWLAAARSIDATIRVERGRGQSTVRHRVGRTRVAAVSAARPRAIASSTGAFTVTDVVRMSIHGAGSSAHWTVNRPGASTREAPPVAGMAGPADLRPLRLVALCFAADREACPPVERDGDGDVTFWARHDQPGSVGIDRFPADIVPVLPSPREAERLTPQGDQRALVELDTCLDGWPDLHQADGTRRTVVRAAHAPA